MKVLATTLFVVCSLWIPARGTTLQPGTPQFRLLDEFLALAGSRPQTGELVLSVLEQVAEGRVDDTAGDLEVLVGLKRGDLRGASFLSEPVRAYALGLIAEIKLPEALSYLENFKKTSAPVGGPMMVWPAAQVALHQALLNRIPDEAGQLKFLEDTLGEEHDALADGRVRAWASGELCSRGSLQSMDLIRASVRKWNPTPSGDRQIAFCEEQMELVSRNPDRVKALGSFLRVSSGFADKDLLGWAVHQLAALKSPAADAELKRFVSEVDGLADYTPLKEHLRAAQHDARDALAGLR